MKKLFLVLISFLFLFSFISATDWYPYGYDNINLQNYYNITGVPEINATLYYGNGSQLTGISSTINESLLNSNSSSYWDNLDTYNSTQMQNNGGTLSIILSWFSSQFDSLFSSKDTDDLTQGSTNLYDNQSFNQSLTDSLYASLGSGNSSFNQSLTDSLYAGIEWDYNQTTQSNSYTDVQIGLVNTTSNIQNLGFYNITEILAFGYYNSSNFIITDYFTKTQINSFDYYNNSNFPYTHLGNFTDNLGDRGYTSNLNFSNDASYYNSSDFSISDYFTSTQILAFNYYNSSDFDINDYITTATLLGYNYYNSTDFVITDYYTKTQIDGFNFYNSSDFSISDYYTKSQIDGYGFFDSLENFTGTLTNNKICIYNSTDGYIYCDYTDQTGAAGNPKAGDLIYLYNDTDTMYLNETKLNLTIEDLDTDTTYTDGSNMSLDGTIFNWDSTWTDTLFVRFTELVSQVGNWSLDSSNYYNSTQVDTEIVNANVSMKDYVDVQIAGVSGGNSSWNESYANTLYYSITNPSGFYNSSDFSISDYYTKTQIGDFNYYNSTDFSISDYFTKTQIENFGYYNSSDFSIGDYYLNSNPNNFLNQTDTDLLYAVIGYGDTWNKTYADTLYADISVTGGNESWNESYADTLYAEITEPLWTSNQSNYIPYTGSDKNVALGDYNFSVGTSDFFVNSNGNVGIGTTTPSQKLEVNGSINISGSGASLIFPDGTTLSSNSSIGGGGDNESWNESYADTQYADISVVDTDTTYSHLTNFTNDAGFYNASDFSIGDYYTSADINGFSFFNTTNFPYTHLSNFTDDLGFTVNTHLTNFTNDLGIGNWTLDKSSYATNVKVDSLGNWSADSSNYYNTTQTDTEIENANTSMKSYVDTQDSAQDECSEISGCVEGALTSETDPAWTGNQSNYYNKTSILAFGYYNSTDFVITDYYTKTQINNFGYYNSSDFNIADYVTSATLLSYDYYNSLDFDINDYSTTTTILGYDYYNSSDFVITDYYTKSDINGFSYYNSSDFDINDYITTATLLGYNYYNSTDFVITDYYTKTQIDGFNFYNSSDFSISDYATNVKVDSLGNWSDDKSSYATNVKVDSLGNWSADSSDYSTNVKVDSLGNWSADKSSYSTTTEADALYRAQSWDNFTGIPTATPSDGDTTHLSTADQIRDYIVGFAYATITYVDTQITSIGNWTADKVSYTTTSGLWSIIYNESEVDSLLNAQDECSEITGCIDDAMTEVVNDTSPQLGGYLDTNGQNIGSTSDEIENVYVATNSRIYFGDGQEASMYYNGSSLVIS